MHPLRPPRLSSAPCLCILAPADAFCALTAPRAWRQPRAPGDAVTFPQERSGAQLDPAVFAALQAVVSRRITLLLEKRATRTHGIWPAQYLATPATDLLALANRLESNTA